MRAENRLILLGAGTEARRESTRPEAERLAGEVSWRELVATLRARRLLATLGPRLLDLAPRQEPADLADAVELALITGRRHSAYMTLVGEQVTGILRSAGIRCAPLKGPALARSIYDDPGRRMSNDVDVLLDAEHLDAAADALSAIGYRRVAGQHLDARGLPLLHLVLENEHRELPQVELHWRIHWYEERFAREQLLPPQGAATDWRPSPAAELVALQLFYARDGFAGLRHASDLSAWWDARRDRLTSSAVVELSVEYRQLARAIGAAASAAERVVGIPSEEILPARRSTSLRERTATRLADPSPEIGHRQLYAEMGLVDGLLAPPGGMAAFVRRQLLPSRAVLDQHAHDRAGRRRRTRTGRAIGMLARYLLALMRLGRRQLAASFGDRAR